MTQSPVCHAEAAINQDLSDLIGLIYEAALQPRLWPEVLERITRYAPGSSTTIYAHDRVARTPTFHHSYGVDPSYERDYAERWAAENPIIEAVANLAPGEVAGLAGVLDYDAFTQTAFFQEWGRPQKLCDAINLMLERSATRIACVSLHRRDEHGLADRATLQRIELLAPHLLRAVKIGQVLEQATVERHRIGQTLDALSEAVFITDVTGRVTYANGSAHALLGNGVRTSDIEVRSRPESQDGKRSYGHSDDDLDAVALIGPSGGPRFTRHILPLLVGQGPALTTQHLVVVRPTTIPPSAGRNAQRLFGLTNRERDVLLALAELGGVPNVANALGITKNSVRSYVQVLFSKTGTTRQSDLIGLVSTLQSPFDQGAAQRQPSRRRKLAKPATRAQTP